MSTNDTCEFTPPAPAPSASADGVACELPGAAVETGSERAGLDRTWASPSQQERFALLRRSRSVAIVGASSNPARASYFVSTYLQSSSPYDVYFVNPMADEILGQPAYASIADLPVVPDIVDVARTSVIAGTRLDLLDALEALEERHPETVDALVMRDLGSLPYEEIAVATGAPLGTVKARIHTARGFLRERLSIS